MRSHARERSADREHLIIVTDRLRAQFVIKIDELIREEIDIRRDANAVADRRGIDRIISIDLRADGIDVDRASQCARTEN